MHKRICWLTILIALSLCCNNAYCQRDVDFHLIKKFFTGKNILKVKRDYHDPYLWVLAQNNEVFRINSQTQNVDDYTSYFTAYNNLQFVDIAGYSQDTVFVGTNSSKLLELKKGVLKTIDTADGITGAIGQIGVSNPQNVIVINYNDVLPPVLLISTTTTLFQFDVINEKVTLYNTGGNTGIHTLFETTYRNQIYCYNANPGIYNPSDSAKAIALGMQFPVTLFGGNIWYKLQAYGYQINTAYCIKSYYPDNFFYAGYSRYDEQDYINEVYGTEKGLYVNSWNYSIYSPVPYYHYLDGIKVNKVTSIYGLASFPQLIKENLLVGTDQGLYFTNSSYQKYDSSNRNTYNAFTLENDIGNKVINDICVDANSYLPKVNGAYVGTLCEDGAWVAAVDGLYFIKPDYTPYTDTTQVQAINFIEQPDSSSVNICAGSTVTASVNRYYYNGKSIQWYKNGLELTGHTADTLKINTAGNYRAVLYDPCQNIHLQSNQLRVNVISGPVFTFNYPQKLQYCDSTQTTLKVTYSPSYHYQWYTNGALNGDTTSSFVVTQTGKYKVEVSACTNSWVPSKEVEVDLINLPVPQLTADKSLYCAEDTAALTVNVPADPAYTINWYRNGSLLAKDNNLTTIKDTTTGSYTVVLNSNIANCTQTSAPFQLAFTPSPLFTFNYPNVLQYCTGMPLTLSAVGSANYQFRWYKDGTLTGDVTAALSVTQPGKYKVEVSACQNSWVPSKEIQVNFITLPIPVITTDKPAYCIGDNATLAISAPVDPDYTINWYKDNVLLTADANQNSITTNVAGNYTVSIVNNTVNTDGTTCSQTSAPSSLTFNPPPTVSIEKIVNTTICEGQTIGLLAHYKGGTVKWSTGETTDQISVTTPGNYTATVTSVAGCLADTSITVAFLPNPVFSVNDTSVCTYKKQVITLSARPGFAQYAWNGTPGGQTYQVSQPQTVSLTVTDVNGCQASQQIKVADQCPNVYIPNAFTPNGDGINDTWVIEGLDNDPTVSVKVFTRYGNLIFNSKGYGTPWNGEYNAKKLPAAVYYYIVTVKNGTQKFSGSVTIIY